MNRLAVGALIWLWTSLTAFAGVTCTVPYNLQNNTTADATQVMADYNALIACLANAASAGANTDITSLLGVTTPLAPSSGGTSVFVGGTSAGSANAQTAATTVPFNFGLVTGNSVVFVAGYSNSGAMTFRANSTTAKNVYKPTLLGPVALTGGEIVAGQVVQVTYDGTQYQMAVPQNALVTSVAASVPTEMAISGSPITTAGTLALSWASGSGAKFIGTPVGGGSGAYAGRALSPTDTPNGVRAWVRFDVSGNIYAGYNVAGVNRTGTGVYVVSFTAAIGANYATLVTAEGSQLIAAYSSPLTTSVTANFWGLTGGSVTNTPGSVVVFGP